MAKEILRQLVLADKAFAMVRTPIGLLKAELPKGAFVRVSLDEKEVLASDWGMVGKFRDCQINNALTGWVPTEVLEAGQPYVRKANR